ncbi:hypothetical protein [Stappia phage SI01]|uniref:Uncharacterized protein n=1 Tax=Stappia phage SI01 TaxID=2847766 RepID=A0AAE7VIW9_9CAUD|nr:hypothetical protein [Stappia phage SI01]
MKKMSYVVRMEALRDVEEMEFGMRRVCAHQFDNMLTYLERAAGTGVLAELAALSGRSLQRDVNGYPAHNIMQDAAGKYYLTDPFTLNEWGYAHFKGKAKQDIVLHAVQEVVGKYPELADRVEFGDV